MQDATHFPVENNVPSAKDLALNLISQLRAMEKSTDADYVKLLAEKKIYRQGESAISFHLKSLEELISRL